MQPLSMLQAGGPTAAAEAGASDATAFQCSFTSLKPAKGTGKGKDKRATDVQEEGRPTTGSTGWQPVVAGKKAVRKPPSPQGPTLSGHCFVLGKG